LAAAILVMTKMLYVEDTLGDESVSEDDKDYFPMLKIE